MIKHIAIFVLCVTCGVWSMIAQNFVPEGWKSNATLEWYHSRTQEQIDRIDFIQTNYDAGTVGIIFFLSTLLIVLSKGNAKFIWLFVCTLQGANIANLLINGLHLSWIIIIITYCIFAIGLYLYKRFYYGKRIP